MTTSIYGYVKDRNNRGIEDVYVTGAGGCDRTDNGGKYFYDCNPGTYNIQAGKSGYVTTSQSAYFPNNQTTTVNFTVATGYELHASVEGIVLNTDNDPVPNIMVWAAGILETTARYGCITQSDGSYVLPVFMAGDYMIECGKNNFNIISACDYYQSTLYPVFSTIIDFTGVYAADRITTEDDKLAIFNRSIVIKDDLDDNYYIIPDIPTSEKVYAKVRKWTGSTLDVYMEESWNAYVTDGSGGSQYE
jgi:hypothetical protein